MYLLIIFRNTFGNESGVAVLHGGFCVDVGLYLDAVSRAAWRANGERVFFGPPAESCVAAALGDMLLYFGAHVLSNVTQNPQYPQQPREGWNFLKMAAAALFVPIGHKQCNYMVLIELAGKDLRHFRSFIFRFQGFPLLHSITTQQVAEPTAFHSPLLTWKLPNSSWLLCITGVPINRLKW